MLHKELRQSTKKGRNREVQKSGISSFWITNPSRTIEKLCKVMTKQSKHVRMDVKEPKKTLKLLVFKLEGPLQETERKCIEISKKCVGEV